MLPKIEEDTPFLGGPHPAPVCQPGGKGVRWERVGRQSSSEAAATSMPQGRMERSCTLLSQLPSLRRRTFHLLLKEKRSQQPKELLELHSEKPEPTAVPALAPFSLPCSLPLRGPLCICTQDPILPALARGSKQVPAGPLTSLMVTQAKSWLPSL